MDIDPYAVLGVQKDATLPEIKSAHRKLVLKCHPDKIKDESLRNEAQDQFQRVQQAYEFLSDPARRTKYDQKVRLAELRREMKEQHQYPYSSPRAASNVREYRDGRIYEERMPADAYFDDGFYHSPDEQPPRGTSRKHDYGRRPRTEERQRKPKPTTATSSPFSPFRAAREAARDSAKTSHSTRDKSRTKERRREVFEKYESAYVESDASGYDSEPTRIYVRPSESRRTSPDKRSGSSPHKPRTSSTRPATDSRRYQAEVEEDDDEDDYSDQYESKHDKLHTTARDYIMRSKGTVPIEIDSRHRPSRSPQRPREYPEPPASELTGGTPRTKRPSRESVRQSSSRNGSYENLEPSTTSHPLPPRGHYENFKVPSMPTATTSPAAKVASSATRPSLQPSRSATTAAAYTRSASKRDSGNILVNMIYADGTSRSSRVRSTDRYDSGYSSPGTPDMHGTSPPKSSTRYKIVTEPDTVREVPPPPMPSTSSRYPRGYSPPRSHPQAHPHAHPYPHATPERPSFSMRADAKPVRSHTTYAPETRGPRPMSSTARPLFGQVDLGSPRPKDKADVKYAREYGPDDVVYTARDPYSHHGPPRAHSYDDYRQTASRRQSAYA